MRELVIRPFEARDEEAWRVLWRGYLDFYQAQCADEVYKASFARMLDPERPQQVGFLAESEGALLGLAHVIFHAHNWHLEEVCYLQDLYVAPEARGSGAGRALIEAVYRLADTRGAPAVYWTTQEDNRTARQLYDRIGEKTAFIKYQRPA
ncbi:GNAT family N-acetyltransferase [Thioclava kandeliae]|uniref:GNAT family N-acetyltransferase n=1 Tax=Thioclava kandeliae TaxID=3070818 RepID=A0ABV1SDB5_9RHOB